MKRSHALGLIVAGGAGLRALRGVNRWEEWAWRYSAYPADTVDALADSRYIDALTRFTGLHPPLWPWLHAASELWAPRPVLWLTLATLTTTIGVALVAYRSLLAGLLLATSPIALHYCAEVNDYPLLFLFVCAIWVSRERVDEGGHWIWVALAGALAGWTHALGGLVAGVAALTLPRKQALGALGGLGLAALPLLPGIIGVMQEGNATAQPAFKFPLVAADFIERFGPGDWLIAAIALSVARAAPRLLIGIAAPAVVLAGLIWAGLAAPHQFPYLVILIVPTALLAAQTPESSMRKRLLVGVGIVHGLWACASGLKTTHDLIWDAQDRAIDHVLASDTAPFRCAPEDVVAAACSGSAVVLVSGGGGNDDDKRRYSPALWRLRPWWRMPRVTNVPWRWADHRRGHPRLVNGNVVYVFEHIRPELLDVITLHEESWVVVYGDGPRQRFIRELTSMLQTTPSRIGEDHLFHVVPSH